MPGGTLRIRCKRIVLVGEPALLQVGAMLWMQQFVVEAAQQEVEVRIHSALSRRKHRGHRGEANRVSISWKQRGQTRRIGERGPKSA